MADTYNLIALARSYYLLPDNEQTRAEIKMAKKEYKSKYPRKSRPRYRIKTSYKPFPISVRQLGLLLELSLRKKRGYRIVDYLFTIHLLGVIYRMLVWFNPKTIPSFARKHAMGIGAIFR